MTVIRGDAARSLMARTRSASRLKRHSYGVSSWSQRINISGSDQAGASLSRAAALLGQRLIGTSLAQRCDDIVIVMSELVDDALAVSGHASLRLAWTPSHGVLVEVTGATPAAALETHGDGDGHRPHRASLTASAAIDRLVDRWGLRTHSAGTCIWFRITPPAHVLTVTPVPSDAQTSRPGPSGCVEWVVACSRRELTNGTGMPPAMVRELAALLERWHGSQASAIARSGAAAVANILAAEGGGRLRLSGTRSQLLVEVIYLELQATPTDRAAPAVLRGTADDRGSYRTFAETRREYVRWVSLPLPARQHECVTTCKGTEGDGWS